VIDSIKRKIIDSKKKRFRKKFSKENQREFPKMENLSGFCRFIDFILSSPDEIDIYLIGNRDRYF